MISRVENSFSSTYSLSNVNVLVPDPSVWSVLFAPTMRIVLVSSALCLLSLHWNNQQISSQRKSERNFSPSRCNWGEGRSFWSTRLKLTTVAAFTSLKSVDSSIRYRNFYALSTKFNPPVMTLPSLVIDKPKRNNYKPSQLEFKIILINDGITSNILNHWH